jgi:hypothetical protein
MNYVGKNEKFSLWLIKYHAMNINGEVVHKFFLSMYEAELQKEVLNETQIQ